MKNTFLILIILITVFAGFKVDAQNTTLYKTEKDILYREGNNLTDYMRERCRLDIYYPANKDSFATIVWFHGGGITGGSKFIPEEWTKKGIAVVAANYRLSPRVKCPEYIDDAAAAVAWVFHHIGEYGGSVGKIVVSGHSAGGYLASMVGLDKHYLEAFAVDADKIAALIPFSGHTITHFTVRAERGIPGTQPVVDEYAPLYHVRADAPPLYLITGDREREMLGRYEENAYMYRMMKIAGHQQTKLFEMDGFDHGNMPLPAFLLTLQIMKELKILQEL
jgi:acetyl esterase/lipase